MVLLPFHFIFGPYNLVLTDFDKMDGLGKKIHQTERTEIALITGKTRIRRCRESSI